MPSRLPFAGLHRQTAWLRATLLVATFLGLAISMPLWLNTRAFPLLPLTAGFPTLPAPYDKCFFAAMLLALVAAAWFYRPAVCFFLVAGLFAFCEDQNRGQPWFYMYCVMLGLTLWPERTALAACRCALSAAYVWSGIQKLNPGFLHGTPGWFVAPAANWGLPASLVQLLLWCVTVAPIVEMAIGIGLWVPRLRRWVIGAALIVHLISLLFLGPLGHNYNVIVWPWNLAMIGLVLALFGKPPIENLAATFNDLRRSKPAMAVTALYAFLPLLSFWGWWDSDFSFTLYAENQANANIFLTEAFAERLPAKLRRYVHPFAQAYDPQFQGPCVFMFGTWCYEDLHVPIAPEPRNFRAVFLFLRAYTREPKELRILISPRAGPVVFYQGDNCVLLARKK